MGQGIQYRQPVQPILIRLCRMRAVSATASISASFRGRNWAKVAKVVGELLLGAHAGEDEVDVLVAATQRSAHEAALASGSRAVSRAAASAGDWPACRP